MSGLSSQGEVDKYGIIPARLDDLKKVWRSLRSSLFESLTAFSHFGKSSLKASRNLYVSFNHADPSFICKLTLALLTHQAQMSHLLNQSVTESMKNLSKDMDTYDQRLDQLKSQVSDKIVESLKNLGAARANYAKERSNYEKTCKEAETAVSEKKKPVADPLLFYNVTYKRKLKLRVVESLKNLKAAEQQARDALEAYSVKQQGLNVTLSESMRVFKEISKGVFEKVFGTIKIHNQVLLEFLKKNLEDFGDTGVVALIGNLDFSSNAAEQQYFHKRKQSQGDQLVNSTGEQPPKDANGTKESQEGKLHFVELHAKLVTKPEEVTDQEIFDYCELAQKHYDAALMSFEERLRVVKGLKGYLQDLGILCSTIEKTFQKLSKSSLSQTSLSVLCKRLGGTVEPLFEGFGAFAGIFQQLSGFINAKAPLLDAILNDFKDYLKGFQSGYYKALRETITAKSMVAGTTVQHEKLHKKITEFSDKDSNDDRLPILKNDLENVRNQFESQMGDLKKLTLDAAMGIKKVFDDYRNQEQSKFPDFQNIVKGLLEQEHVFAKSIADTVNSVEGKLELKRSLDEEVAQALKQDDLDGFLQYYEINMQENPSDKKAKEMNLVFQKPYVPPEDALTDEEDVKIEEGEEEEDQAGKDQGEISAEKLKTRFGLKMNDKMLDNFACGVEQRIIRQGRMYIYTSAVCFSTVKLLGDIALVIPVEDIVRIEKKTMSLVFDTALSVITKNGEIKFLSFFYRDKAYNLIASLLKEANIAFSPEKGEKKGSNFESPVKQENQVPGEQNVKKLREEIIQERLSRASQKSPDKGTIRRESLELTDEESQKAEEQKENGNEDRKESGKLIHVQPVEEDKTDKGNNSTGIGSTEASQMDVSREVAGLEKVREVERIVEVEVQQQPKAKEQGEQKKMAQAVVNLDAEPKEKELTDLGKAVGKNSEPGHKVKAEEDDEAEREMEEAKEKKRLKEAIMQRMPKMREMILKDELFPQLMAQEVFPCSVIDLYVAAFSDRKVTHKGKSFECFWMLAKTEGGDVDLKYTKWSPELPFEALMDDKESVQCLKKIAEGSGKATRGIVYTHPVDGGPFVPKTCQVEEKHIGYWVSQDEFILQMEVQTSKIPLSDTFFARNCFRVKDLPGHKCEFSWRLGVEFVKSTLFKGKITKTTQDENSQYATKVFIPLLRDVLNDYLKEKAHAMKKREAKKEAKKEAQREFDRQLKLKRELSLEAKHKAAEAESVKSVSVVADEGLAVNKEEVNILGKEKEGVEEKKVEEEKIGEKSPEASSESEGEEEALAKGSVKGLSGLEEKIKESIDEGIGKLISVVDRNREEARSEIRSLRQLVVILIGMNCVLLLLLFMGK